MASSNARGARKRGAPFTEDHLVHLRPLKISRGKRDERFAFRDLGELKGTSFDLCSDEVQFAFGLIGGLANRGLRKHNLWLFRTCQKKYAGDFVIVDVSRPTRNVGGLAIPEWEVFVLDLKMHGGLQFGGRGAGIQLKDWSQAANVALRAAARMHNILPLDPETRRRWDIFARPRDVWRLTGDRREVLDFFNDLRLFRRYKRRSGAGPLCLEAFHEARSGHNALA